MTTINSLPPIDVAELVAGARAKAQQRRFDEAIVLLEQVLEAVPDHPEYRELAARMCVDANRLRDADRHLTKRIQLKPQTVHVYRMLASIRRRLGEIDGALGVLKEGLALLPKEPDLHVEMGGTLSEQKKKRDALACYQKALELDPNHFDAHNNLAVLLQDLQQLDRAIVHLRKCVEIMPENGSGLNNLGVALADKRQFEEALELYRRALDKAPRFAIAWNNLGNSLRSLGRSQEAADALGRAIELQPDYAEAYNNLAITFTQLEESRKAIAAFDKALFLRPDYPEAHMNRGLQHLLQGNFLMGWADYEWRWHEKLLKPRRHDLKRWDGSPLVGKKILVYYEQGLGDTFHFIRYAAELKARGATVVFECQPILRQILSRVSGVDEFILKGQKPPKCDFGAPLLSLPGAFQTNLENLPCTIPYISANPELVEAWRKRLATIPGFKVGIVWQGNPEHRGDWKRSIPLRLFEPLARIEGVTLVSLQKGYGIEQLEQLKGQFEVKSLDGLAEDADGFERTAAIMKNLDLIICADTSVAHLAGAMGIPAWVAVPVAPDWRWLLHREDTPWYPSLRLFRQRRLKDWEEVFERIRSSLKDRIALQGLSSPVNGSDECTQAIHHHASQCLKSRQWSEAESLLCQLIQLTPKSMAAHQDLGVAYAKQGKRKEAIECFRRAVEIEPNATSVLANLGRVFFENGQLAESIASLKKAIRLGAGTSEVHNNLGVALANIPDPAAAEESFWAALRLSPFYLDAHVNLARALLIQGKLDLGWQEFEWRWKWREMNHQALPIFRRKWNGESLKGKRILLQAEQGLSDTLQFVRYAKWVKQFGGHVTIQCQESLVELLKASKIADDVVPMSTTPHNDLGAALMSLPGLFRTTLESIPSEVPYVHVPPALVSQWTGRIRQVSGVKVGILWQATPEYPGDAKRSLPLRLFDPSARIDGVELVSLQQGEGVEQIMDNRGKILIRHFDDIALSNLTQTAAVIANLDLVITVDAFVAHLAGAMGKAVWVLLPPAPDWRWLLARDDSPWYPTMRLNRHRPTENLTSLFDRIAQALKKYVGDRKEIQIGAMAAV